MKTRERMFGLPGIFTLAVCDDCGLSFLVNPPHRNELVSYYPKDYGISSLRRGDSFRSRVAHVIKKTVFEQFFGYGKKSLLKTLMVGIFKPFFVHTPAHMRAGGGKLLDIGFGNGELLRRSQEYGWDVYGVDTSETCVGEAKKAGLHNVFLGTLEEANFRGDMFDYVSLSHVLEHVHNPVLTIREVFRIVKPEGRVLISIPNFDSFERRLFKDNWFGIDAPRHLYHFPKSVIVDLLIREGFTVEEVLYTERPVWFSSSVKYLLGLSYKSLPFLDVVCLPLYFLSFFNVGNQTTIRISKR